MFWNKKGKIKTYLTIWYEKGLKSQTYGLGEIPIKEEIVIRKSIDFFSDPEPCYIHRGAVVVRLNEEILMSLSSFNENQLISIDSIEKHILEYIALPQITAFKIENK